MVLHNKATVGMLSASRQWESDMAYVRTKGNQVLLVHGARSAETRGVEQQTLFTFYTKAEIEAAIGEHREMFRHLVEAANPTLRLDWAAIENGLRSHLDQVPDIPASRQNEAAVELRRALVELTRVVWELEPQELQSANQLVDDNRGEISLLVERLQWLLHAPPPASSEFTRDTPSLWRQAAKARSVPLHGWEQLDDLWNRRKYTEVGALAGLLSEAFPMFADGHNYLGLAAMERGDLTAALANFQSAQVAGRKQFPRRIAKSRYWSDHDTRPFLRAIMHEVAVHNRLGEYKKALDLCDRLERDFGQDITAEALRVPVLLNDRQWQEASRMAERLVGIYPENHFLVAFAALEVRDPTKSVEHFVRGALELPAAAGLVIGVPLPKGMIEDARDHNHGVALLRETKAYRAAHGKSVQFFRDLWSQPVVRAAVLEADEVRQKWRADRSGDRKWFDETHRLQTMEHAREVASKLKFGHSWALR